MPGRNRRGIVPARADCQQNAGADRHHSLTLFAFDQGEAISTHESGGDAMVLGLDGQGVITIDGREHLVHAGEAIVMPAKKPHAVLATEPFKMLLIVLFPEEV